MHLPGARVAKRMRSEEVGIWFVPANQGEEIALLIKLPSTGIQALLCGCGMSLAMAVDQKRICLGVQIFDIPDKPLLISNLQHELEEHLALERALVERAVPVFLFNELDVCVADGEAEFTEEDAQIALGLIQPVDELFASAFTQEEDKLLDRFGGTLDPVLRTDEMRLLEIQRLPVQTRGWRSNESWFVGLRENNGVSIDDADEGSILEKVTWASLESVFPLTLHRNPTVREGGKSRELTDVLAFHEYGAFLLETKALSVLKGGHLRPQERRTKGVQGQVEKALRQLVGASKRVLKGTEILDRHQRPIEFDRSKCHHCIALVSELPTDGDWAPVFDQLVQSAIQTSNFFHVLDLRELITLLKGSRGNAMRFDYHLIERCKVVLKNKSLHVRSRPAVSGPSNEDD